MQTRSSPNRVTLLRLARQAGISDSDKMSKNMLFNKLQEQFNIERLTRAESRKVKSSSENTKRKRHEEEPSENTSSSKVKAKKERLNRIDPIMLVPIGKKKTFKFARPNGIMVQFNVDSLVDYLLSTGDFIDPETRLPFTDAHLKEIDQLAKEIGLQKASVFEAKKNINTYSEAKFRRDALLALERCAGEVIADMLQIVENYDPDDAQMQLAMREFPLFVDFYRQLQEAEPEYASKCMAHWRLFISGPPNKPNKDGHGLIKIVSNFLKNCNEGNF